MHAAFASNPGESHTAERSAQVSQKPAIYPRNTRIHLLRHSVSAFQIRRPDGSGQAIFAVIRHTHRLFFRIERSDVAYGSEDFFFHAARRLLQSSINRWLNVEPLIRS